MAHRAHVLLQVGLLAVLAACGPSTVAGQHTSSQSLPPSPSPSATAQLHRETLTIGGVARAYELFVPSTLDAAQAPPLMVVLHPCPATAAQAAVGSHLDDVATMGRFIAVYPEGAVMAATGGNCWNAGTCCTGADDVDFISRLIDQMKGQFHIDMGRVFVAGFSFGASMAYRLGCQLADKVTAIAPVSGALVFGDCHPARPVSVLMMQGTQDTVFPYQGGGDYSIPAVATVASMWAALDGCGGAGAQSQTGIVTTTQWRSCRSGAFVRLDVVAGAPHAWFGGEPNPLPGEPNANSTVWNFFASLAPKP